jgi:hypothetical protein
VKPRAAMLVLAWLLAPGAQAGTQCVETRPGPQALVAASATALRMRDALEEEDAPVALLARAGTDLARYDLHYSHAGFVVRDHPDGRWTVVHLLNACGTAHSSLYAQGLVNYFVDNLVSQDARLVWLAPAQADRLAAMLAGPDAGALHDRDYNVIARFDSPRTQNSTAWVLEVLAASRLPAQARPDRRAAQLAAKQSGHRPDTIRIAYSKRILGGLFSANADFTDHPVATRLAGEYPVVTVRSILRWLRASGAERRTREWIDGVERGAPGPA